MNLDYNTQKVTLNTLEVENIGNISIEASNDDGYFFYAIVRTVLGTTWIHTFGPIIPDSNMLLNGYSSNSLSFDFSQDKLEKYLKTWLNDKKKITEAKIVDFDTAIKNVPDLAYLIQISE